MDIKEVVNQIDLSNMDKSLQYFSKLDKLSGGRDAEKSADYIIECLKQYGIHYDLFRFSAYLSNPISSTICIAGHRINSRPRSFSANCCCVKGMLIYDSRQRKSDDFSEKIRGKIVISYGYDERYAKYIEEKGALGWIQIWQTPETELHEDTVSPIWGTPDMESRFLKLKIPVAVISYHDGGKLLLQLKQKPDLTAEMCVEVENVIREVQLPVAYIKGKKEKFVMVSNHYDTWYFGAYDNGSANAATLELARLLKKYENSLNYSVRICWWPGHSNGRYMGSAWYCDNFWLDLKQNCIAHINCDLMAAKGSEVYKVKTSGLEGIDFIRNSLEEYIDADTIQMAEIGRDSDQSFWGTDIPYNIGMAYDASSEKKSAGAEGICTRWWHTPEDTYDKVDLKLLKKETQALVMLVTRLCRCIELPCDVDGFIDKFCYKLEKLEEIAEAEKREQLDMIRQKYEKIRGQVHQIFHRKDLDAEIKNQVLCIIGGTLNRLYYSNGSRFTHDPAFQYEDFGLLGESCKAKRQEDSTEEFLYAQTSFIRMRNRIAEELNMLYAVLIQI